MNNRIDEMIGQALTDEDRALLARHGEPGYFAQAFGLFRGPMAWVMWLGYFVGFACFIAAMYSLWRMTAAEEVLAAVKWGVGAAVLIQFTLLAKGYLGLRMESNRLLREIKRVELQVSLARAASGGAGG